MKLTLMRTPVYCAHPIEDRQITDQDRCFEHIDMGEREFEYRIMADNGETDKNAEIYNQPVFSLAFFPSGIGEKINTEIVIKNPDILMTCYRVNDDGNLIVRLFNSKNESNRTMFKLKDKEFEVDFTPYEVKTFIFENNELKECNMLGKFGGDIK